jgi:hypothetical protein
VRQPATIIDSGFCMRDIRVYQPLLHPAFAASAIPGFQASEAQVSPL